MNTSDLAPYIQHTRVRPETTRQEIASLAEECVLYGFNGCMVAPIWLDEAAPRLRGTPVLLCTALGYPMGGDSTTSKIYQLREVIAHGAQQVDFMPAIGYLKSREFNRFRDDCAQLVAAAEGVPLKAMLEFGLLNQEEKLIAAELAVEAGVAYVKNSSGFGEGGSATREDVALLKKVAGDTAKVKASGGIRHAAQAIELLEAGADLLGTSAGVAIVQGKTISGNGY